jgi:hypothetical protein
MDWLATLIYVCAMGTLGVVYPLAARKYWRGEAGDPDDEPPSTWPFSREHWQGVVRSYVAAGPFAIVSLGAGALGWAFPVLDASAAGGLLLGVSAGALGVILLLYVGVILFNRPKTLVPPHLRSAPGLLEVRRLRRRRLSGRRGR